MKRNIKQQRTGTARKSTKPKHITIMDKATKAVYSVDWCTASRLVNSGRSRFVGGRELTQIAKKKRRLA